MKTVEPAVWKWTVGSVALGFVLLLACYWHFITYSLVFVGHFPNWTSEDEAWDTTGSVLLLAGLFFFIGGYAVLAMAPKTHEAEILPPKKVRRSRKGAPQTPELEMNATPSD